MLIHKLKMRRNPNGDYIFDFKVKDGYEITDTVTGGKSIKLTVIKRKEKENGKQN